eukprot:COSAG01_NODE_35_length_34814_cov_128.883624_8_plen_150_part_00
MIPRLPELPQRPIEHRDALAVDRRTFAENNITLAYSMDADCAWEVTDKAIQSFPGSIRFFLVLVRGDTQICSSRSWSGNTENCWLQSPVVRLYSRLAVQVHMTDTSECTKACTGATGTAVSGAARDFGTGSLSQSPAVHPHGAPIDPLD